MGQNGLVTTETIENEALIKQGIIFDLNYNPAVTPLLAQGSALGIKGINGFKMLIFQALKAEEIWLSMPFPIEAIANEILEEI